jgi:hypothetical protein
VDYVVTQDPTGEVSRKAVCVSGDDKDCGKSSEGHEADLVTWMTNHRAATGHSRFQRVFTDYAVVEPKP